MITPEQDAQAREMVQRWIARERAEYADTKFVLGGTNRTVLLAEMERGGIAPESVWMDFIGNYLKRAQMFGLNLPQGRQALGKTIVTLLHALETATVLYGSMPEPGHSSGTVREWDGT